jgi:hypothetical protein
MNKYKIFFKMFLILFSASVLFADVNNNSLEQQGKTENEKVSYQNSEKGTSESTDLKSIDKQKEEKEHFIADHEKKLEKYLDEKHEIKNTFPSGKSLDNEKLAQYNITGLENTFKLSDKELKHTYNINGTETIGKSAKISLTKYQQEQLKYLEMERKYKILVLDNEINLKKKMISEELASDFSDVFLIDELSKSIKSLAVDRETVDINVEKKIRYVLSPEQYLKYKQNKKTQK